MPDDDESAEIDGRRARAERSRIAVLDAVIDLFREGTVGPGVDAVAERAGVSRRSVFRHFDDMPSLYAAAIDRHVERMAPLSALPPTEPDLTSRVHGLVTQRGRLYEEMTPIRVVTERLLGRSELIDQQVEAGRLALRRQLANRFAPELADGGEELLDAIEAATSWACWHVLRTQQHCSIDRSEAVVVRTVLGLFGEGPTAR